MSEQNIPVITFASELQAYAEKSGSFLHGFGSDLGIGIEMREATGLGGELIAQKLNDCVLGK